MPTVTSHSSRPVHVKACWDPVKGEVVIGTSTIKGLGALHAPTSEVFHDMLLRSVSAETTVYVTDPDDTVCVLRRGKPPRFLHS